MPSLEEIAKVIESRPPLIANGIFGDMEDCHGIVEQVLTPPDGGTFIKVLGVKQLFKGYPDQITVEWLGLAKGMISMVPRQILSKSWLLMATLGVMYLFARRRFIHYLHVYAYNIWVNTLPKLVPDPHRLNRVPREIQRATEATIRKFLEDTDPIIQPDITIVRPREFYESIALLADFFAIFIELDSAYRSRLQDICENVNKEAVKENVYREVDRLFKLGIAREHNIQHKWIDMRRVVLGFLLISKQARDFIQAFLLELDLDKMRNDEDDWYYSLRRAEYDHRGMSIEERVKLKEQIDRAAGNIILHLKIYYCSCMKINWNLISLDENNAVLQKRCFNPLKNDFEPHHRCPHCTHYLPY